MAFAELAVAAPACGGGRLAGAGVHIAVTGAGHAQFLGLQHTSAVQIAFGGHGGGGNQAEWDASILKMADFLKKQLKQ